ncbi:MAG: lamin tail domain-containing protein [Candidatus Paceibacterota bacterium]
MNLKKYLKFLRNESQKALLALFVIAPFPLFASVEITEIMYDAEGADEGREWIEIRNTSGSALILSEWKFFEGDTNHGLKLHQGNEEVAAGEYVVIVDSPSGFLADFPNYSGTLFDSSWGSLSNTGETLTIRDPELNDVDSVTYSSEWGAQGDGNSLQKSGNEWIALAPTPGESNSQSISAEEDSGSSDSSGVTSSKGSPDTDDPLPKKIVAYAGNSRIVYVGADSIFEGTASGNTGDELEEARYLWTFGNGEIKEGKKVLHHYDYPGRYAVRLSVSSGKYGDTDQVIVEAIPAEVFVSDAVSSYVELSNASSEMLDLSMWYLMVGDGKFQFPEGTLVLSKEKIRFPRSVTNLSPKGAEDVVLLYPNLRVAAVGAQIEKEAEEKPRHTLISSASVSNNNSSIGRAVAPVVEMEEEESISQVSNEVEEREEASAVNQTASVGDVSREGNFIPWLLALLGVLGVGAVGVVLLRGVEVRDQKELSAEDFDIEEIDEK